MFGFFESGQDFLLLAVLVSGLSMIFSTRVLRALNAWTLQNVFLTLLVLMQSVNNREYEIMFVGILVLFVKGGVIPWFLRRVLKASDTEWVGEVYLKRTASLIVAGGLTVTAYVTTKPFASFSEPGLRYGFTIALALLFYGLLLMMVRKVALIQVLGILLMDNGIFLAGLFLTKGMPLLVEMGALFDILVGVVILAVLAHRMLENYHSLNVDHLKTLKG